MLAFPARDAVFLRTDCAAIIGSNNKKVLSINIPKLKYNINQIQNGTDGEHSRGLAPVLK